MIIASFAQFIILVIDSTDRDRLHLSKEELWRMLANDDLRKAAILIYANKQDVKGARKTRAMPINLVLTHMNLFACPALLRMHDSSGNQ